MHILGYREKTLLTSIISSPQKTTEGPSFLLQPLVRHINTPIWATSLYTAVILYPVRNILNVQAILDLTTGEENKPQEPHKMASYELSNIAMTMEEQDSAIRLAFRNEETTLKKKLNSKTP